MSNKLVKNQPKETHIRQVQQQQQLNHFQGPIPPPDHLAGYEQISPGFADRIVKMAEDQANHRYAIDHKNVDSDISIRNRMMKERRAGQFMAFAIAILFPCLGVYLIMHSAKIEGSIFGGIGLVPVIYAFIPKKEKNENGGNK